MKKFLVVFALVTILAAGTAFADHPKGLGIGVMGTYGGGWGSGGGYGGALSLKLPSLPIFWGISMHAQEGYFSLGLQGDVYIIDKKLAPLLHWYLGLGGWLGLGLGDTLGLSLGARLPIGLSLQPLPLLELFIDFAPSLGVAVSPVFDFPAGGWQVDVGIRLWI